MDYGFIAVLPPLIAIGLAVATKDVLLSILAGVFFGVLALANFNPALAFLNILDMVSSILGSENIGVVLIVIFLGGLVGLLVKSGGNGAFSRLMARKIKNRAGVQIAAWLMGICIFFDDYFNCLTIGTVMRPMADAKQVSREKLAYIIDSTSASMCTLTPVSSWVAYIIGIVGASFATLGITDAPLAVYIQSIPYNMYSIFAVLLVPIVALRGLDFGPMAKAERRAQTATGLEYYKDKKNGAINIGSEFDAMEISDKGKVFDLVLPIVMLFVSAFLFMFWTGGLFEGASLMETFQNADSVASLYYAIALTIIVAMVFYRIRGSVKIKDAIESVVTGMKSLVLVVVFMTCAWLLGSVCEEMGTGEYLVNLVGGAQVGFLIPCIIFVITCVTTFATGSGWGSIAIMTPIAIPLAFAMDANMAATLAAVLSGVVFGDHCSPICDTTIISSAGSQCSHIDHCKTQIPYSVTAASAAAVGFLISGFIKNPIIPLLSGFVIFVLLLWFLHKLSERAMLKLEKRDVA